MPVTNYETFDTSTDTTTTTTLLHESIPLTGTIVSGTYGTFPDEGNIKNYSHGMFQSVFDYPYLSSSANHIFDITMGYDESSALSGTLSTQNAKKINTYNQFAQILLGYTGSENQVEIFESDLSFADNDRQMKEVLRGPRRCDPSEHSKLYSSHHANSSGTNSLTNLTTTTRIIPYNNLVSLLATEKNISSH